MRGGGYGAGSSGGRPPMHGNPYGGGEEMPEAHCMMSVLPLHRGGSQAANPSPTRQAMAWATSNSPINNLINSQWVAAKAEECLLTAEDTGGYEGRGKAADARDETTTARRVRQLPFQARAEEKQSQKGECGTRHNGKAARLARVTAKT